MVDYGIEGEVALVLGGTGGLGFACAQALTAAGAQLLINGRDADRGREAVQALCSNATYLPGDVSQAADRTSVFDEVQRRGGVSILVTNAGGPPPARFLEAQPEAWTRAFETNVLAAVEAARSVLPGMIERRFGRIVNITSFVVKELLSQHGALQHGAGGADGGDGVPRARGNAARRHRQGLAADHQNKADIGLQTAPSWFDVDGVDMIVDVPNSAVVLAVQQLGREEPCPDRIGRRHRRPHRQGLLSDRHPLDLGHEKLVGRSSNGENRCLDDFARKAVVSLTEGV